MELLFVVIIAAAIGATARYSVRGRHTYGAALLPSVSAAVASVVWVALLWLGLTFDGTWIWVAALGTATIVSFAVAAIVPRRRDEHDREMLLDLTGAKA